MVRRLCTVWRYWMVVVMVSISTSKRGYLFVRLSFHHSRYFNFTFPREIRPSDSTGAAHDHQRRHLNTTGTPETIPVNIPQHEPIQQTPSEPPFHNLNHSIRTPLRRTSPSIPVFQHPGPHPSTNSRQFCTTSALVTQNPQILTRRGINCGLHSCKSPCGIPGDSTYASIRSGSRSPKLVESECYTTCVRSRESRRTVWRWCRAGVVPDWR